MTGIKFDAEKMVPAIAEDVKQGNTLLLMNDSRDLVGEFVVRGKIVKEKKWPIINPDTGEEEWVNVEPDWSYRDYIETMNTLYKSQRLWKWKKG